MVCVRVKMEVAGAHWNFLLLGASLLSLQADFSASVDWCGSVQSHAPVRCLPLPLPLPAPGGWGRHGTHLLCLSLEVHVPGGGVLTLPFQWSLTNAFGPFLFGMF